MGGFLCPVIYLSLFSDEQVDDYLKKRFPKKQQKVFDAKILLSRMRSLRFRPMLLAHIEDLLLSETQEWTEYSIYHALVSAWLFRERAKALSGRRMPEVADLWEVCSALALHLHASGQRELAQDALEDLIGTNFRHLSKLDIGGRSLLNMNSQGAFRFSHYSILEFLVARDVILGASRRAKGSIRATDQLLRFLLSWLASQDVTARSKLLLAVLNLEAANLAGADLRGVNLQGAVLRSAQLDGADIAKANLRLANLNNTQMSKTKMGNTDLKGAKLVNANLPGANLQRAILCQADLSKANLEGADLNGAELAKAILRGARLAGADLKSARLKDADLLDAICDDSTVWPDSFDYQAAGVKNKSEKSLGRRPSTFIN